MLLENVEYLSFSLCFVYLQSQLEDCNSSCNAI